MGKRLPTTPRSQVRSALRKIFLRSRERAQALKDAGYRCEECGVKQSKAKGKEVQVEVHHLEGLLDMDQLIDYVYRHLVCSPELLIVLCRSCHQKLHEGVKNEKN